MKYILPLFLLALLGGGCASPVQSTVEVEKSAESAAVRSIVFSADFSNGEGCTSAKDAAGCDLYMATLTNEGTVEDVTQLTDTSVAEAFPVWHPTDNILYFDSQQQGGDTFQPPDLHYLVIDTGETGTLVKYAAHASILPAGDAVIYSSLPKHILTRGSLSASHTTVSDTKVLVAGENRFEPMVSGDGNLVIFHETSETNAGASIYNIRTQEMTPISAVDGTGHCAINAAGTLAVCDQKTGGGLAGVSLAGGKIGETSLAVADPTIAAISRLDEDYANCDLASVNFPSFFDNETLLVSISCHQRGPQGMEDPSFAKLFLVDLQMEKFTPLGKRLAEAYGGIGRDSRTADVR